MDQRFIMTAFGTDRPGIVADVTGILYDNGCNLEETSMTLLADEFTLILLFSAPGAQNEEVLQRECRRLEREKGISAFLRPLQQRRELRRDGIQSRVLHVEGLDQAGIVYQVSRFLSEHRVNIVDLKSTVTGSPQSGAPLYVMDIHVQIPAGIPVEELEKGLSEVADELHVDISVSESA